MSRRLLAVGSAIGLLLPLAACGGDDPDPKPSTSQSASASSSPSESPTASAAPSLPAEAEANTKAGAIAFVKHYVDLINYAQQTGETQALVDAAAASCRSCRSGVRFLQEVYGAGGSISGGHITFTPMSATKNPGTGDWVVLGGFEVAAQDIDRGDGEDPEHLTAGRTPVTFQIAFRGTDPKVKQWSRSE